MRLKKSWVGGFLFKNWWISNIAYTYNGISQKKVEHLIAVKVPRKLKKHEYIQNGERFADHVMMQDELSTYSNAYLKKIE